MQNHLKRLNGSPYLIFSVFHDYVERRRLKIKQQAADTIRQFFQDVHEVSKLMKIIKKYRYNVIRCQNIVRTWLEIRRMRIMCVTRYWDKCTSMWWETRRRDHTQISSGKRESMLGGSLKKGKVVVGVCISVNGISRRRGSVLNSNVLVKVAEYVWLLTPAISKSRSLETIMNKGV